MTRDEFLQCVASMFEIPANSLVCIPLLATHATTVRRGQATYVVLWTAGAWEVFLRWKDWKYKSGAYSELELALDHIDQQIFLDLEREAC